MKFSLRLLFLLTLFSLFAVAAQAQADTAIGQITVTTGSFDTIVRDISGDGRFVVFESTADVATDRTYVEVRDPATGALIAPVRNNADGNYEIFLFDYAQRRIFQITNTTRALKNVTGGQAQNNVQVDVVNRRPSISNDGRWIAFDSNAYSTVTGNTTPAFFDGNLCIAGTTPPDCNVNAQGTNARRTTLTALQADGNSELWLYRIPDVAAANLSSGAEVSPVNLAAGTFLRATDSQPDLPPLAGTDTSNAVVRESNNSPSINDDGTFVAFVSDRNLVAPNNADRNREIFVFRRTSDTAGALAQVTRTDLGPITQQNFNLNPSISGNGRRVMFLSTATNPVAGGTGGSNADGNLEVFYADLDANAAPTAQRQITVTTRTIPEQTVNFSTYGRRISRDGRFLAFESLSDNPGNGGTIRDGYALYVFDATPPAPATAPTIRQIGEQSFADAANLGGDFRRYPVFTDYVGATPQRLVFTSRFNYTANGTIPATASEGLNPDNNRPVQLFATPLFRAGTGTEPPIVPTVNLRRLTRNTINNVGFNDIQLFTSNSLRRSAFSQIGEFGGGNSEFNNEAFYLLTLSEQTSSETGTFSYRTGASARPVGSPLPIPSPSVSPSASPSPTPITPSAVTALAPGMIATVEINSFRPSVSAFVPPSAASTARSFELPIELNGVSVIVNGAAAGIYSVDERTNQITFVIPPGTFTGAVPFVVIDNGRVRRGTIPIVTSQPDIFNLSGVQTFGGGRARIFNVTRRVAQGEPFTVFTFDDRPRVRVPTVLRVFLTGVIPRTATAGQISIRIGSVTIPGTQIVTAPTSSGRPGEYYIDFRLPSELNNAGDVPIVITVNGQTSRLDDTAPRLRIL